MVSDDPALRAEALSDLAVWLLGLQGQDAANGARSALCAALEGLLAADARMHAPIHEAEGAEGRRGVKLVWRFCTWPP